MDDVEILIPQEDYLELVALAAEVGLTVEALLEEGASLLGELREESARAAANGAPTTPAWRH